MDVKKGQIAASKAGHDDGRFFIVTEVKDGYAYIADGKERKLSSPKKKNLKHLAKTNTVVSIPKTDKSLRKLLSDYSTVIQED